MAQAIAIDISRRKLGSSRKIFGIPLLEEEWNMDSLFFSLGGT